MQEDLKSVYFDDEQDVKNEVYTENNDTGDVVPPRSHLPERSNMMFA